MMASVKNKFVWRITLSKTNHRLDFKDISKELLALGDVQFD